MPIDANALTCLDSNNRLTEFYDDYLDSYGVDSNRLLPPMRSAISQGFHSHDRVPAWTRGPNHSLSRSGSQGAGSNYSSSSLGGGGGTIRRRGTNRTATRTPGGIQSPYEEEEGYASGDYDDAPFELAKIRVKVNTEICDGVQANADMAVTCSAAL